MEIRRFGTGHRRPDGPPGTHGVEAQPIHVGEEGVVAELALRPNGAISPHSNPNLAYFLVIEGGGWVQVGGERSRVSAGDAVTWPPNVDHAAWTEGTPMRAIVVEFAIPETGPALLVEGSASDVARADGELAPGPAVPPAGHSSAEEEPW